MESVEEIKKNLKKILEIKFDHHIPLTLNDAMHDSDVVMSIIKFSNLKPVPKEEYIITACALGLIKYVLKKSIHEENANQMAFVIGNVASGNKIVNRRFQDWVSAKSLDIFYSKSIELLMKIKLNGGKIDALTIFDNVVDKYIQINKLDHDIVGFKRFQFVQSLMFSQQFFAK